VLPAPDTSIDMTEFELSRPPKNFADFVSFAIDQRSRGVPTLAERLVKESNAMALAFPMCSLVDTYNDAPS
jgi:hypothetical protein